MTRSVISIASNFDAPHQIRGALERLAPEECSRVFLTKVNGVGPGAFHNLSIIAPRCYSQEELREIEVTLGRQHAKCSPEKIEIDLDLQFTGDWRDREQKRFNAVNVTRSEWRDKSYVGIPIRDLIRDIILPDGTIVPIVADSQARSWMPDIIGSFPLNTMPNVEGSLQHHEFFIGELLKFLETKWQAPDSPIAAQIVHNGTIVRRALSQARSTGDSTAHAEMVALREASREFGRSQLRESWLYSTHAPCPMCRETAVECGVRGMVWAIDPADAPKYYRELNVDPILALSGRSAPTLYRGIGRERALELSESLARQLSSTSISPSPRTPSGLVETTQLYDALAAEYHDPELHPVAFAVSQIQRRLRNELATITLKGDILDVGCGPELPPAPGRFIGLDLSPAMVAERMRKAPGEQSHLGDIRKLPFSDRKFSAAFAGLVLDHVESLHTAAAELARVLHPSSHLIVTLLAPNSLPESIYADNLLSIRSADGTLLKTPIHRWNKSDIETAFSNTFSLTEHRILPLGIRTFELAVYRLIRK